MLKLEALQVLGAAGPRLGPLCSEEPVEEPVQEPSLGDPAELVGEPIEEPGLGGQSSPVGSASPVVHNPPVMTTLKERQLVEMFARYKIEKKYIDKFTEHKQMTPHDVYRSGINMEKAQTNMCLSPLPHSPLICYSPTHIRLGVGGRIGPPPTGVPFPNPTSPWVSELS